VAKRKESYGMSREMHGRQRRHGGYSVVERVPSVEEYNRVRVAAGLRSRDPEIARVGLANTLFGVLLFVGLVSKDYIRRLSDSIRCLSRTYPRVAGTACPSATCPFVVLVRLDPTEEEPCGTC
jgi:hypothetical protein